ncbi:restriction endonuclease subunit S [Pseudomonas fluorescens]|uniref:restriction endonuclease subunit S n=1 Tax=Pseudomonas fluorescens TaxID=294 RepID=UPI00209A7F1B|nr:restriction endonuclease subunit S [Pseudomonas fluorescens]MCO7625216.1 restriction endonuclease subunit S [Pseudomonas fluorescens]
MTVLLTENLPLLSGAPDGIKKLRELILELAVRGKLVPQDPSDEPAGELLKSITAEQLRLMVEEGLRTKAQTEVPQNDQYLKISSGWAYSRLGNLARFIDYRGRTPTKTSSGIPLITAKNVRSGFISREPQEFIAKNEYSSWMTRGFPRLGDLLFTTEAPMGNVALVNISEQFALAQRVICFQLHEISIGPFLKLAMMSSTFQRQLLEVATGMTATGVKSSRLKEIPVPLPPLAEQQRIAAKVDELMTLCDRMEAQQADSESAHAQLVQVLLDSLTQTSDATDFASNWQRLAEHFHTLFTTESSIDALKQTLLQLAVTGKLVPQDVSGCLQVGLPSGWDEIRIEKFCTVQGGIQKTPLRRPISQHFPYLRVANVQRGRIDVKELERYELSLAELAKWRLNSGDLLIVEGNGSENEIGRCAIWRGEVVDCVYQNHLMRVRPEICEQVEYLALYLNSPVGIAHMKRLAITTSGLFNLSVGKIRSIPVALPPVSEQRRIVAKVDQLMELCDQLKTRLTQARLLNEQLASTLIEHALAEDAQQLLHTMDRQAARTARRRNHSSTA